MEDKDEKTHIWKVVLAYDGAGFHGWQVQPGQRTVQGELSEAIERITGERTLPQGSGRTDAGVHALAQVASFRISAPIPEENLARALNRTLPEAIRVLQAQRMQDIFHARHSARGKTYEYRIYRGELCPPWLARYVYAFRQPLDLEAMQQAARSILGEHDFTSFATTDSSIMQPLDDGPASGTAAATEGAAGRRGNVRTVYDSQWTSRAALSPGPVLNPAAWGNNLSGEDLLVYRVRGNGFLHRMVRNLVGTFLQVGRGNLSAESIPKILAARRRSQAGPTVPARGLFLVSVDY